MLAQMQPYTPTKYLPSSFARYRQYPHTVVTPIPGAGYDVGKFVWAEQELNLDGSGTLQPYGSYAAVPLRGLGSAASKLRTLTPSERATVENAAKSAWTPHPSPEAPPEAPPVVRNEWEREERAGAAAAAASSFLMPSEETFFDKKLGPVPLWAAIGGGALVVVGGGAWWLMRKR